MTEARKWESWPEVKRPPRFSIGPASSDAGRDYSRWPHFQRHVDAPPPPPIPVRPKMVEVREGMIGFLRDLLERRPA